MKREDKGSKHSIIAWMYLFSCECATAIIAWLLLVVETRFKAKTSLKMKMEMKIYIYFVSFHFICHIYFVWLYECDRTAYSRNLFRTQYPFFVLLSRFEILNVACIHGFSMKHVIVNVRMCEKKRVCYVNKYSSWEQIFSYYIYYVCYAT